jgi:lipoprotein-releasing system permease protein
MAFRYLFSRKRVHVINLISGISVVGVATGTAALIILLSAFNGLENWVVDLYNTFDPDLKIEAQQSTRFFKNDTALIERIKSIEGVQHTSRVIEENSLITFGDARCVATLKGVDSVYFRVSTVEKAVVDGNAQLFAFGESAAIFGSGVAYSLGLGTRSIDKPIEAYIPKRGASYSLNPSDAFSSGLLRPIGIFQIQPEIDLKYVLINFNYAANIFDRNGMLSSLEIKLHPNADVEFVKSEITRFSQNKLHAKDRFEQHALLYKIINSEKWAVYLILTFILIIAVFNVTGCLTMLLVDKSDDVRTLRSMGASHNTIRRIFFAEGLLIGLLGLIAGVLIGCIVVYIQYRFGLVLIQEGQPYPVYFKFADLTLVAVTVCAISALAAWIPVRRMQES